MENEVKIAQNETAIKLISQDIAYMKKGIDDIQESVKDLRQEIVDGFVSKNEFDGLRGRVNQLESLKEWSIRIIIGGIIISLLALLGIRS